MTDPEYEDYCFNLKETELKKEHDFIKEYGVPIEDTETERQNDRFMENRE